MIRLPLILLLQLIVFVSIAQTSVYKPYFPREADPALWEEAWLLTEANEYNAEKADSLLILSMDRLTQNRQPAANLMVVTLLADYMGSMGRNPARGKEILDNSGKIFSSQNDTLHIAWVYRYSMMAYNSVYTRNAAGIATHFRRAYHVLMTLDNNHPLVPVLQYNLMQAFFQMRKVVEGFEYFNPLIEHAEKNDEWFFMVNAYLGAGNIIKFYNPGLSLEFLQYAFLLANRHQVDRHLNDPFLYISLGSAHTATDHHKQALEYYQEGLETLREHNPRNKSLESSFLYYMGVSHGNMGNYFPAINYLDSAATLEMELAGKSRNWHRTMGLKGKNLNFAQQFDQAQKINQEVYNYFKETTAHQNSYYFQNASLELMRSYAGLGEYDLALQLGQEAIYTFLAMEVPEDLFVLPNLTQHISPDRNYLQLEEALYLKLDIMRQMALENPDQEIITHMLHHFETVTHITDFHASVVASEETLSALSARFKHNANKLLDGLVVLEAAKEQMQEAYLLAARSKAYLLQTENIINQYHGKEGSMMKSQEEKARRAQLNIRLLDISPADDPEKWEELTREILHLEKNIFVADILNPVETDQLMQHMASGRNAESVNDNIRKDEMVIDFYQTEKHLHTFVITDDSFHAFSRELPGNLSEMATDLFRQIKMGSQTNTNRLASAISEILFKDIETDRKNHLTIIPDENLHALPFDILLIQNNPLLEAHAISYRYSSHLYRTSTGDTSPRFRSFLAMAPVFDNNQPLESDYLTAQYTSEEEYRDIIKDGLSLAPLPATLEETEALTETLALAGLQTMSLERHEATRANFKKHAPEFDIIHLSTHGFSNNNEPEKSGLALFDSISNEPGTETFVTSLLKTGEIATRQLNADLVVLSACKSGYGAIHKGEGIMGISRGFIAAGANNVVASLWKVHDQKTRMFMLTFYGYLLQGKEYAEALRLTKLEKQREGWLTMDWAGFILIDGL